jgi:serine/threonine-protein kinase HipA
MLEAYVGSDSVGRIFKPESTPHRFHFAYDATCPVERAVSLTMPVVREHYASALQSLHPIFDMNLPEGALASRLRQAFSKVIPGFDALAMLKIVGRSQIGRLRFALPGDSPGDVPSENLHELLAHDGAQGLFEHLLSRYAVHSGISGAMPKVLVRSDDLNHLTHKGATHIVKAWTPEHPRLAENEYFCMRAALHAGLEVPQFELSHSGQFLVIKRFDLTGSGYLGFEDFCVLNGKTALQKYDGSYENIARRIHDFVSPEHVRPALVSFFKALALSCALKNGDAHLKNFGVLYANTDSAVRLAPIYDLVTTTVYKSADILALTLGGTKRWPSAKALMGFARSHCNMGEGQARQLLAQVAQGVELAHEEAQDHIAQHPAFRTIGTEMLAQWREGLAHAIQT